MLNGLGLFEGIGGLSIALSNWVCPIAVCEIDPYCQGVLLSRMCQGLFPRVPIWDDIKTMDGKEFRGAVDIIYGGVPCQGFSIAGTGKGLEDERSGLFSELIRLCSEIIPTFIFLENVPSICSRGGSEVVRQITALGYDSRWCVISAHSVGSPQERERWFLLAHLDRVTGGETYSQAQPITGEQKTRLRSSGSHRGTVSGDYWVQNQRPLHGMVDGLPFELDRAKGLGNSVCPQQAEKAFKILMGLL